MSPAPEGPPERPTGWEALERWVRAEPEAAGAGSAPPAPPACAVCGAPLEADQTYCLECGSPTPLAPRLTRSGRRAAIVAGALLVLGVGAGALAYAVAEDDGPARPASTTTTTTPGVPLPADTTGFGTLPADTTGFGTLPADTTGLPATTGGNPVTPPTQTGFGTTTSGVAPTPTGPATPIAPIAPAPSGSGDWPAGRTAWTAQLASLRTEAAARAIRDRVRARGEEAGVLYSSDFDELRPGYYVVFSGTFDSRSTAISHAASLRGEHPGAFARQLSG